MVHFGECRLLGSEITVTSPAKNSVEFQRRQRVVDAAEVWVVKIGSRSLTTADSRLDRAQIENISGQLADLRARGKQVVLVSSGAVASGVGRLGLAGRPKNLATLQAVAQMPPR